MMRKRTKSKLDKYAEQLAAWEAENATLESMKTRLADQGCAVSLGRLSNYFASRRAELRRIAARNSLFDAIRDGAATNHELDRVFNENPSPDLARLVDVTKSLVFSLKVRAVKPDGKVDKEELSLASLLLREITHVLTLRVREREMDLTEQKFKAALKSKLESGLDALAAALRANPEAMLLYQQARDLVAREMQ